MEKEKLWSRSFFLIWQGQLVSTLGDAAYSIALGFWVLQVTGSTALMGTLMAASALPGVLIAPFAGVWVDRLHKKPLVITMDILRGIGMVLVAAAAYSHMIAIWMVFVAGILLSLCGAIFRPGISSSIPNLVPKSRLSNANSLLSIVSSGANMLGSVAGGIIYQFLGAPLLFLFNGLSYFFSGSSLCFASLPNNRVEHRQNFWSDMREGFHYMWKQKGLRYLLIIIALINFFSYLSIVLFLPLFQRTSYLGAGRYGIAIACFMGGCVAGFLLFSVLQIPSKRRMELFISANILSDLCFIVAVYQRLFGVMLLLLFLGGLSNSVMNVIHPTVIQTSTPDSLRGKVLSMVSMSMQSLSPLAMALGGIVAAFIPIKLIITTSFSILILVVTPFAFVKSFRKYMNTSY